MKRSLLHRRVAITVLCLTLLFITCFCTTENKEVPVRELLSVPGKFVSEAKSTRPTTELKLTGYRVEEIRLPRTS